MTSLESPGTPEQQALAGLPEPLRRHLAQVVLSLCGWNPDDAGPEIMPDLAGRRIAFCCRDLCRSGSGRVLIEQMAALEPTGAELDLFHFEPGVDSDVVGEIAKRCPGVRRIERVSRRIAALDTLLLKTWPARHELFISTDTQELLIFSDNVAKFRLMRPPRVAVILHEEYDRYLTFLKPRAGRISAFCLDYDFRERFMAVYGQDAPAGVVAPLFPLPGTAAGDGEGLRRELGIPADARVLGYAGRLGRNKRIERMIEILAALLTEGREQVWLLLAGRWEEETYRSVVDARMQEEVSMPSGRRIRLADRVRWAGPRFSLGPIYAAMDVFLLLSRAEGFYPLSVMEAQQAGVPVVCTGAGGLARVILDGVTGFCLPGTARSDGVEYGPDAAACGADRVRLLLDAEAMRVRMGEAGREVVLFLTAHYPFARLFRRWVAETLARKEGR